MAFVCRYHLQAFRHLYVLAAEPRVVVTREVDTWDACYVPLLVTLKVMHAQKLKLLKFILNTSIAFASNN